jgi:hypothetical protein
MAEDYHVHGGFAACSAVAHHPECVMHVNKRWLRCDGRSDGNYNCYYETADVIPPSGGGGGVSPPSPPETSHKVTLLGSADHPITANIGGGIQPVGLTISIPAIGSLDATLNTPDVRSIGATIGATVAATISGGTSAAAADAAYNAIMASVAEARGRAQAAAAGLPASVRTAVLDAANQALDSIVQAAREARDRARAEAASPITAALVGDATKPVAADVTANLVGDATRPVTAEFTASIGGTAAPIKVDPLALTFNWEKLPTGTLNAKATTWWGLTILGLKIIGLQLDVTVDAKSTPSI